MSGGPGADGGTSGQPLADGQLETEPPPQEPPPQPQPEPPPQEPQPPPLDRNLSTVGIGPVFLTPPPADTLAVLFQPKEKEEAAAAAATNTNNAKEVETIKVVPTHEFVGRIKSTPDDFVVREIGGLPRSFFSAAVSGGNTGGAGTGGETTGGEDEEYEAGNHTGSGGHGGGGGAAGDNNANGINNASVDAMNGGAGVPAVAARVADITDTETLPVRSSVAHAAARLGMNPGITNTSGDTGVATGAGGGAGYNGTVRLPSVNIGIGVNASAGVAADGKPSKRPRLDKNNKNEGAEEKDSPMKDGGAEVEVEAEVEADNEGNEMLAGMPHDVFITSKAAASASASAVIPSGKTATAAAAAAATGTDKKNQNQQAELAAANNKPSPNKLVKIIDPAPAQPASSSGQGPAGAAQPPLSPSAPKRSASVDTTNSEAAPLSSHLSPPELLELLLLESGSGAKPSFDGQAVLAQLKALHEEGRAKLVPPPPPPPVVAPGDNDGNGDDADAGADASSAAQVHLISDNDSLSKAGPPLTGVVAEEGKGDDNDNDNGGGAKKAVWIPHIANDIAIVDPDYGIVNTGSRGTFHRSLKTVFPMLKSTTLSEKDSLDRTNKLLLEGKNAEADADGGQNGTGNNRDGDGDAKPKNQQQRWVRVEVDESFLPLVPLLLHSKRDLLKLYQFRNRGCVLVDPAPSSGPEGDGGSGDGYGGKRGSTKHRGRRHRSHHHDRGSGGHPGDQAPSEPEVALRLQPNLSKEQRREVHTLLSSTCRDFETSTINGEDGDCTISVRWSKQAKRIASRKRKRIGGGGGGGDPNSKGMIERSYVEKSYSTLCVMKKRQVEHLAAINNVVSVLRCRQSDIGLAGIKDLMGVTYQFCTLRNVNPRRARDANKKLRTKNMELGNFERVDFALNQGDLLGNTFEVIVRDVKSVVLHVASNGGVLEEFTRCQPHQIEERVEALRRTGFVNFYGEQRVGFAGDDLTIGVRPFDIGRAMLQNEFSKAIDLLMRGRIKGRGDGFAESEEIRKARALWRETGGNNPSAVLKSIPRGFLDRERSVLKGLKRYGTDQPLAALRCLHHGVRMFWINAYQSFCWNKMATERIKRLGPQPAVGDLYQEDGLTRDVKVVTDPSKVTLGMIVLPLPGYDVEYPSNEIGDLYRSMLAADGVEFKKDAVPEATAKGAYRNLVAPANNLSVSFMDTREDGSVGNARFSFELQSGSYATMLLRELMCTTMGRKNGG